MDFEEYQKKSKETAIYPAVSMRTENGEQSMPFLYPLLGLVGEAGEVAEIIKRIVRDRNGSVAGDTKESLQKELGDVLWYLSQVATEFGLSLDDIAKANVEKLQKRARENKLHGKGSDR